MEVYGYQTLTKKYKCKTCKVIDQSTEFTKNTNIQLRVKGMTIPHKNKNKTTLSLTSYDNEQI